MEERIHHLEQRVAELERRLAALSSPPAAPTNEEEPGTTLVAPVRIVDSDGHLLALLERHPNDLSISLWSVPEGGRIRIHEAGSRALLAQLPADSSSPPA